MKRIIGLFLILFIFYLNLVKVNIVCNDGTISSGCSDCHNDVVQMIIVVVYLVLIGKIMMVLQVH